LRDVEFTDEHIVPMELKSEFLLARKFNSRETLLVDG
jgi:hypothetical protein